MMNIIIVRREEFVPDECALGADFRVIDSTFYFS